MPRAFERKVKFDPEKGVDYDAIPTDPAFHEWLKKHNTENCSDCYDEETSKVQPFQLNPPTKETE